MQQSDVRMGAWKMAWGMTRAGVLAGVVSLAVVGCGGGDRSGDASGAPNASGGSQRAEARVGAIDETFRRGGGIAVDAEGDGLSIEETFGPLDLPTASERRLGSGKPGPDYWQQQVDYVIDCTLTPAPEGTRDFATGRLEASVRVTYHNNSPHELDYLWMQLEQNLFRTDSIGTQARTPGSVMKPLTGDFQGGYTITRMRTGSTALEFFEYDTLARVELPRAIMPGERFVFEFDYAFEVPPHLRRMGAERVADGMIFEFAQWFPHVCNYDDVHGWNALPYLGNGEFYTNFGSYRVSITAPGDYLVMATGDLMNATDVLPSGIRQKWADAVQSDETVWIVGPGEVGNWNNDDRATRTWVFEADDVRTFAWAASDAFHWDAAGANVTMKDGRTRRVLVQSFYPAEAKGWFPEHKARGSTQHVKHAVEFYSDFAWPYPYSHMTNVNGPEGGMEYPMIMFCGDRDDDDGPFGVTDHEVGHTWFPMIVNSDERRHMWQDEGFNTFMGIYSNAAWKGTEPDVTRHVNQALSVANADRRQPIIAKPDIHWNRWVGRLNYRKTALGLYLLREEILGRERFDRAFRGYIDAWAFKHPQPADFFRAMEDGAGADLAWFWRGWFYGSGRIDQGVRRAVDLGDGRVGVDLVNEGEVVMPVTIAVTYSDGTSEARRLPVEIWHSADLWRAAWSVEGGKTITRVELDPNGVYPDVDESDDVWEAGLN